MINYNFNLDLKTNKNKSVVNKMDLSNATVTIDNNRLAFSKDALKALGATAGDRITVNYYTVDEQTTFPVIGKSEIFSDADGGNKLTKSNTISFRGRQRETLSWYGKEFSVEYFKNYFKLVPMDITDNDDLSEENLDLLNI